MHCAIQNPKFEIQNLKFKGNGKKSVFKTQQKSNSCR